MEDSFKMSYEPTRDKATLRRQLQAERQSMVDRHQRSVHLQEVLRVWLVSRNERTIGAYWPIKGEFDALPALYRWSEAESARGSLPAPDLPPTMADGATSALAEPAPEIPPETAAEPAIPAAGSGRRIGLPVINRETKQLRFHVWYPGCPMEEDAYGIPKPKDTEAFEPELLLVPCVGFGPKGLRLGYGGGFYDRTLAALRPRPFTVGLGFSHGYVPWLEPAPHDVPLDAMLAEDGVVYQRR